MQCFEKCFGDRREKIIKTLCVTVLVMAGHYILT